MSSQVVSKIINCRLPQSESSTVALWDITIKDGTVASIDAHVSNKKEETDASDLINADGRLLAPSLCHAHIHLDKCFLLQDLKYADLAVVNGDFQEAMDLTHKAKARFEEDDLMRRGRQLIEESIHFGVTDMRAFVEVDEQVKMTCLHAGLKLKEEFKDRCNIQICAFAQLPLFADDDGEDPIRDMMVEAASRSDVDVVGSTPYVEKDESCMKANIRFITALAKDFGKMLDLHLDYHLDESKEPLVWYALDTFERQSWMEEHGKQITMGHCTRLTAFDSQRWSDLWEAVRDLPVSFVGLPTSDLFMMRTTSGVRGTLNVIEMIKNYGFQAAIAVNNVGNAFTPYGSCDPLSIATLGVGLYQAGTKYDTELLFVKFCCRGLLHQTL
jgi:cytosine/adenosine deaminase-related metal-dependent hydrolase